MGRKQNSPRRRADLEPAHAIPSRSSLPFRPLMDGPLSQLYRSPTSHTSNFPPRHAEKLEAYFVKFSVQIRKIKLTPPDAPAHILGQSSLVRTSAGPKADYSLHKSCMPSFYASGTSSLCKRTSAFSTHGKGLASRAVGGHCSNQPPTCHWIFTFREMKTSGISLLLLWDWAGSELFTSFQGPVGSSVVEHALVCTNYIT